MEIYFPDQSCLSSSTFDVRLAGPVQCAVPPTYDDYERKYWTPPRQRSRSARPWSQLLVHSKARADRPVCRGIRGATAIPSGHASPYRRSARLTRSLRSRGGPLPLTNVSDYIGGLTTGPKQVPWLFLE